MALVEGTTLTNGAIVPVSYSGVPYNQPYISLPPAPVGVAAPVAVGGGGVSGAGAPVAYAPSPEQFQAWVLNSPLHKQGMEILQGGADTAISRIDKLAALQAGYSSGGGYSAETVPQAFYDQIKLAQEKAAHDYALQQASIPEIMAGRGQLNSGQTAFELGEAKYGYDTLLKDLDLQKRMREQQVAEANKSRASAAAASTHNASISSQINAMQNEWKKADILQQLARDKYQLVKDVGTHYKDLYWVNGFYIGPTL